MRRKATSVWLALALVATVFTVIFVGSVSAVNNDHNLSGIVYKSDGSNPGASAGFCIWVNHSGVWNRFPSGSVFVNTEKGTDPNSDYWYSYVLPYTQKGLTWDTGDQYKVHVQGGVWNEFNGNTTSDGSPGSPGDPYPTPYDPSNENNSFNDINWFSGGGLGNEQQWNVRTVAPVDLVATNVTVDGTSVIGKIIPVAPNRNVPIFFNLTNIGIVDSGSFTVTLWQQGLPSHFDQFVYPSIPGGGDSGMLTRYWQAPTQPGTYSVDIIVDSEDQVAEFDETNNIVTIDFIVGPNLRFNSVFIEGSPPDDPHYVGPDMNVTIEAWIENNGVSPTGGDFTVRLVEINETNGQPISSTIDDILVPGLGAGESVQVFWTWRSPATVLTNATIRLTVDINGVILESNENDNEFTIKFRVPDTPVTTIVGGTPLVPATTWYIGSTTNLHFDTSGNYGPFTVYYMIIDMETSIELVNTTIAELAPFNMAAHGEGTYRIEFYAIDDLSNVEIPVKFKTVIVDDSEPTTSVGFSSPRYRESAADIWNITSTTPCIITAQDNPLGPSFQPGFLNGSGIGAGASLGVTSRISYRILRQSDLMVMRDWTVATVNTVVNGVYTCAPFTFDNWDDDWYVIESFSVDRLGHVEPTKSTTIYLDNEAPLKTWAFDTPKFRLTTSDLWNITSGTDITLSASDGFGSGVNNIQYRVIGPAADSGWVLYTLPLTVPSSWNDNIYSLQYNSTDNLGNDHTESVQFYLDNTGPDSEITAEPSTIISTTPVVRREINLLTLFNLTADDGDGCGVPAAGTVYWLDSDTGNTFTADRTESYRYVGANGLFLTLTADQRTGNHTINVQSEDNLGNTGPVTPLYIYLMEDEAPPDPPVLTIFRNGDDILLEWYYDGERPLDIFYFKIYQSSTVDGFDFQTLLGRTDTMNDNGIIPLRSQMNHTGAGGDSNNYYYTITAVDTKGNEGYNSNIVGKVALTFTEGYNTFGLPLELIEGTSISASQMLSHDDFTDDRDTIYRFDTESQQWMGFATDMPSATEDFTLQFGEGYMIYVMEDSVTYSFVGASASAIRFKKDALVGNDVTFKDSLKIVYQGGSSVLLSWDTTTSAPGGYNIYRGTNRYGTDSLNDFDLIRLNTGGPENGPTYTATMSNAHEYFLVVALDAAGMEGSSTWAVGASELTFTKGYSVISMPLQPEENVGSGYLANNMFDDNSGTLFHYDKENAEWAGHPRVLPENINNVNIDTGSAYIVYVDAEDAYVITGV